MTRSARKPPLAKRRHCLLGAAFVASLSLGAEPGCSTDSSHPSLVNANEQTQASAGAGANAGGGAGEGDGAPPGADSGAGGDRSDEPAGGGEGGDDQPTHAGGGPSVTPSSCSKTAKWTHAVSVANVSSTADETLLSATPDELDLAFVRDGSLYVAHRAKVSSTFDIGQPVVIPTGWTVRAGASLSADGKRLLLSGDGESKLGELTRSNRGGAFSAEVDTTAFAQVNQDALYTGKIYAFPAVSPGDDQLFYNSAFPSGGSSVVISTRTGEAAWSTPQTVAGGTLDGKSGSRRLPSSVSADARTLFYFNEESMNEEARWRDSALPNSPLYDMLSLGERRGAVPNSACDRLYSESDSDVVVETD